MTSLLTSVTAALLTRWEEERLPEENKDADRTNRDKREMSDREELLKPVVDVGGGRALLFVISSCVKGGLVSGRPAGETDSRAKPETCQKTTSKEVFCFHIFNRCITSMFCSKCM